MLQGRDYNANMQTLSSRAGRGCITPQPQEITILSDFCWRKVGWLARSAVADNYRNAGGSVEGGVDVDDDITPETPLQLASAAGKLDIVELLLSFGASPFLSTLRVDTMSFGSSAQKGCYCALSTAASHGQRKVLHKLGLSCSNTLYSVLTVMMFSVTHPTTLTSQNSGREVLSLEGDPG